MASWWLPQQCGGYNNFVSLQVAQPGQRWEGLSSEPRAGPWDSAIVRLGGRAGGLLSPPQSLWPVGLSECYLITGVRARPGRNPGGWLSLAAPVPILGACAQSPGSPARKGTLALFAQISAASFLAFE